MRKIVGLIICLGGNIFGLPNQALLPVVTFSAMNFVYICLDLTYHLCLYLFTIEENYIWRVHNIKKTILTSYLPIARENPDKLFL